MLEVLKNIFSYFSSEEDAKMDFLQSSLLFNRYGEKLSREEKATILLVLIEAATADDELKAEEWKAILEAESRYLHFDGSSLDLIQELIHEGFKASEVRKKFTASLARFLDEEQRQLLLGIVWQIILADNRLAPGEKAYVERIGNLLKLKEPQIAAAKTAAREGNL